MPLSILAAAIDELTKVHAYAGRDDNIMASLILAAEEEDLTVSIGSSEFEPTRSTDAPKSNAVQRYLSDLISSSTEGAYFLTVLLQGVEADVLGSGTLKLTDYLTEDPPEDFDGKEVTLESAKKYIRIYFEDAAGDLPEWQVPGITISDVVGETNYVKQLNIAPKDPDRLDEASSPSLGAICVLDPRVGVNMRHTDAVAIFCNSVPAVEMSRCTPYLEVNIIGEGAAVTDDGKVQHMSTYRFLGVNDVSADGAGHGAFNAESYKAMIGAVSAEAKAAAETGAASLASLMSDEPEETFLSSPKMSSGMELFCSPQTMVNADIRVKNPAILDPFRPLMSIESFKMNYYGIGEMTYSSKTAQLNIVVHDRSRLSELDQLISITTFGDTYFVIEYGWSHPDGSLASSNPWGQYLNSLRWRETMQLIKTDVSIGNDGQARLAMDLVARGGYDGPKFSIATGKVLPTALVQDEFERFVQRVSTDEVGLARLTDIRMSHKVNTADAGSTSNFVPRYLYDVLLMTKKLDEEGVPAISAATAASLIEAVLDEEATDIDTVTSIVTEKLNAFSAVYDEVKDPFLRDIECGADGYSTFTVKKGTDGSFPYVSLGRAVMTFIGAPLAHTRRYDEVQVIFYPFNRQSGAMRTAHVGEFPIPLELLRTAIIDEITEDPMFSCVGFGRMLASDFIGNYAMPGYGLVSAGLESSSASSVGTGFPAGLSTALEKIYEVGGPAEAVFQAPDIQFLYETHPAHIPPEFNGGETYLKSPEKLILKIHVFDRHATPNREEIMLLGALNNKKIQTIYASSIDTGSAEGGSTDDVSTASVTNIVLTESEGGTGDQEPKITTNSASPVAEIKPALGIPLETMKALISRSMPTIIFGASNTAITQFTLGSTTSGDIMDAKMLRAIGIKKSDQEDQGKSTDLGPISVMPQTAQVSMLGCPMLLYAQQFFLDMRTGTTMDNCYTIKNVSHTISPGAFTSTFTAMFTDQGTMASFNDKILSGIESVKEV